ncbi:hypothetical protein BJ875DRAFT_443131 [Amylocarpus encephaloides]|uniref:Uncharacterized protein n=1 Tax=Amylocarpus encephaloides TaxID=45428 RepID=A0A9P8C4X4_9HELO|nr:hypothetical protein BJ875DRAFT_443131 [Amylocarpus encephaloides]
MTAPVAIDLGEITVLSPKEEAAKKKAARKALVVQEREKKYFANVQISKDLCCLQCRVKGFRCQFSSNQKTYTSYERQCYDTRFHPTLSITHLDGPAKCCVRCTKDGEFCLIPGTLRTRWGNYKIEESWWARGIATDVAMARANELLAETEKDTAFVPSRLGGIPVPKHVWEETWRPGKAWWKWKGGVAWAWDRETGGEFFLRGQED